MFHGLAHLNLDNKSRLAVPTRYRDALSVLCGGRLVITADPAHLIAPDLSRCLLIYPEPEWKPIHEKTMRLSALNPQTRSMQRILVGYAEVVEMDGAGRVLVSSALREFAKLDKRVVLVGQGNKFELWDEESWVRQCEQGLALKDGQMPVELEGFAL
ncbi:MAG: division/cell wall cluster transcriptional repressor MraZ [Prolixibacteraceae bacterium]|nr:division/cell wall cluster transcriptional repressor MraZ [Burkholderiales bacterium]